MWLTVPFVLSACSAAASTDSTAPSTPSLDEWASMSSRSLFVSWMMDVPSGWWNFTALTSFAPAETPSSKPKRRKRSGSSGSASSVDPISALE